VDWNVVDVFVTTSGMLLIIIHVVKLCFAACLCCVAVYDVE